eukprot:gene4889-3506_t
MMYNARNRLTRIEKCHPSLYFEGKTSRGIHAVNLSTHVLITKQVEHILVSVMLDINLFRDPALADIVRESERRRFRDPKVVDEVIKTDEKWRRTQYLTEQCKKMINHCSKAVGARKKAKESDGISSDVPQELLAAARDGLLQPEQLDGLCVLQLKELSKALSANVVELAQSAESLDKERDRLLNKVGNIIHESVPVADDEEIGNVVVRTFGDVTKRAKLNHVDCMERLGLMHTTANITAMSGGRAYVLRGALVQLQLALVTYGMQFLVQRDYDPFYPPFFLNKPVMANVAELADFDDSLYKVSGDGDEKYLIATSEMALVAFHQNKWYTDLKTPLKYGGYSSCFRKEAGAHGRDTLGIFRVHQFEKIEQFVVCSPRDQESWKALEEVIGTSQAFYESLGLPYRTISICSGALNNAAAKKYDLEGWFPGSGAFRELVSCSNCTDYQSRGVNCRYGPNLKGQSANAPKEYCHMLNGTLTAITRTICCICENYQTDEGVVIPEVLRPFMMGKDFIPFPPEPEVPAEQQPKKGKQHLLSRRGVTTTLYRYIDRLLRHYYHYYLFFSTSLADLCEHPNVYQNPKPFLTHESFFFSHAFGARNYIHDSYALRVCWNRRNPSNSAGTPPPTDSLAEEHTSRSRPAGVMATTPPAKRQRSEYDLFDGSGKASNSASTGSSLLDLSNKKEYKQAVVQRYGQLLRSAAAPPEPTSRELRFPSRGQLRRRYKRLLKIGEGSFGEVFIVYDTVACAYLTMKRVFRLLHNPGKSAVGMHTTTLRELELLSTLEHPNIVPLIDYHLLQDGTLVLFLPLIRHDFSALMRSWDFRSGMQSPCVPLPVVKCVFRQMLEGVGYLHAKRVIHRDLKPSNIMIDEFGVVRIIDFGWSRFITDEKLRGMTGPPCTTAYRPPEVLIGGHRKHLYDFTVDTWCCGCVLFELLMGRSLSRAETEVAAINTLIDLLGSPPAGSMLYYGDGVQRSVSVPPNRPSRFFEYCESMSVRREDAAFLYQFLQWEPKDRIRLADARNDAWFRRPPAAYTPAQLAHTLPESNRFRWLEPMAPFQHSTITQQIEGTQIALQYMKEASRWMRDQRCRGTVERLPPERTTSFSFCSSTSLPPFFLSVQQNIYIYIYIYI